MTCKLRPAAVPVVPVVVSRWGIRLCDAGVWPPWRLPACTFLKPLILVQTTDWAVHAGITLLVSAVLALGGQENTLLISGWC